ncbi:MAG: hypothetical protein IJE59_04940 [Clostridia bacterium]|nr:hypothetical protein [Clostridia bacterium]
MKKLLFTNMLKSVTQMFNTTFLGIYFLKISGGNISEVALFYIIWYMFHPIFMYMVSKKLNKDNIISMYRTGILLDLICFLILFLSKGSIVKFIYPFAILMAFREAIYWIPQMMLVYNVNQENTYKKYFTYTHIIEKVWIIISTLVTGYLITENSYDFVFMIIIALGAIVYITTFSLDKVTYEQKNIETKKMKEILKNKDAKRTYEIFIFHGMNSAGVLVVLIQLVIFMQFNSEFSIGYLNAIFAIIATITSILVNKYIRVRYYQKAFTVAGLVVMFSIIPMVINTNFTFFVIYNIALSVGGQVLSILLATNRFQVNQNAEFKDYRLENIMLGEIYLAIGRVTGFILLFIVGNIVFNILSVKILIMLSSLLIIVEMIIYNKLERYKNVK